jgi:pimeloyl-ACP methyl ester carboxylesterase
MYEYQYQEMVEKGFRVVGITLRGFVKSGKPYGKYDYDVYADNIKVVLGQLNVNDATLFGFSMGVAIAEHYVAKYNVAHVSKLALFGAAASVWTRRTAYALTRANSSFKRDTPKITAKIVYEVATDNKEQLQYLVGNFSTNE